MSFHEIAKTVSLEKYQSVIFELQQEKNLRNILIHQTESNELSSLLNSSFENMRKFTHVFRIGLRYEKNNDYPYFRHIGFPMEYIFKENSLLKTQVEYNPIKDKEERFSTLKGLEGLIIRGIIDKNLKYFTKYGSFWINDSKTFLRDIYNEYDEYTNQFGNLLGEGGSVALIPIKSNQKCYGLFHLSDPRKNKFKKHSILFIEIIAKNLGLVIESLKIKEQNSLITSKIKDNLNIYQKKSNEYNTNYVTICASCKNINIEEKWIEIEKFIQLNFNVTFSHGYCPHCADDIIKELK